MDVLLVAIFTFLIYETLKTGLFWSNIYCGFFAFLAFLESMRIYEGEKDEKSDYIIKTV